jgi:hypothetical protein
MSLSFARMHNTMSVSAPHLHRSICNSITVSSITEKFSHSIFLDMILSLPPRVVVASSLSIYNGVVHAIAMHRCEWHCLRTGHPSRQQDKDDGPMQCVERPTVDMSSSFHGMDLSCAIDCLCIYGMDLSCTIDCVYGWDLLSDAERFVCCHAGCNYRECL